MAMVAVSPEVNGTRLVKVPVKMSMPAFRQRRRYRFLH